MYKASPFKHHFNLGWCHKQVSNYQEASEEFLKDKNYKRAFECLEHL